VFWEEIRSTTHLTRPLCYTNVCLSSSCIHRRHVSIHTRISPGHGNRHLGEPVRPRTILSKVLKIIIRRTSIKYGSIFIRSSYGDCFTYFWIYYLLSRNYYTNLRFIFKFRLHSFIGQKPIRFWSLVTTH